MTAGSKGTLGKTGLTAGIHRAAAQTHENKASKDDQKRDQAGRFA